MEYFKRMMTWLHSKKFFNNFTKIARYSKNDRLMIIFLSNIKIMLIFEKWSSFIKIIENVYKGQKFQRYLLNANLFK